MEADYRPKGWLGLIMGTRMYYSFHGPELADETVFEARVDHVVREIGDRGKPLAPSQARAPLAPLRALAPALAAAPTPAHVIAPAPVASSTLAVALAATPGVSFTPTVQTPPSGLATLQIIPSASGDAAIEIARMMFELTERDRDRERSDRQREREHTIILLDRERERSEARLDPQQMQGMIQRNQEEIERLRSELLPHSVRSALAPTFCARVWRWLPRLALIVWVLRSRTLYMLAVRLFRREIQSVN